MFTLKSRGKELPIRHPLIMGVVNRTPDSFYAASRMESEEDYKSLIDKMVSNGVDIIDVGGQSTKPGAEMISIETELDRVIPTINYINEHYPTIWISIDTFNSAVAEAAVLAGALIVNDISAGTLDDKMIETVSALNCTYCCMHMQGSPETMQHNPTYDDVVEEVIGFLKTKITACRRAGIDSLILDPGFGFGKTIAHNYQLVKQLNRLSALGFPLLTGFSRKSMIYKVLETSPDDSLNGTTVLNTYALLNGTSILRVHDVLEARQAVQLINTIMKSS
jgi:dihydropteroate synthase